MLYNGEPRWWAKTDLAGLGAIDLPGQLQCWQPRCRYLLLEEQGYPDAELAGQRNLAAALFRLEKSRTPEDIGGVLAELIAWLRADEHESLRRAIVAWLKRVLLPARVPGAEMPNVNDLEEMNATLAERVKTWTEEWKQQGLQQGMQQGIHRGEEKLLRRLLIRRFATLPPWVDERLAQAIFAELELWADRVLDASTLEAIFSD